MGALEESKLQDLVNILDEADRHQFRQLAGEYRERALRKLERCLVNAASLGLYLEALEKALHRRPRYHEVLDECQLEQVLRHGLSVLEDEELIRLALNPLALMNLYDRILDIDSCMDDPSEYWMEVLYQETFSKA